MSIFNFIKKWKSRKEKSDLHRVRITSNGAFYMKTEDLFNDKEESLMLLTKLNKSIKNHNKKSQKSFTLVE